MTQNKYLQAQTQTATNGAPPSQEQKSTQAPDDFSPSPDEVARRAYFGYLNEGSLPGRDVQHWLAAEAQLIEERNRTRTHGFHNKT